MSYPQPSLPGRTYAISRRCSLRSFFLRPSPETNQVLGYCLGVALGRHPTVRLLAFTFLSNHYHNNASDDLGDLSSFYRDLNGLIARAMNCHLGRGESFWSPGGVPKVPIFDDEALWEQLVYTSSNPVKDGLVSSPEAWPGLISTPEDVETKVFRFERPEKFFRSSGKGMLPEVVEFVLERPLEFDHMSLEDFKREYRRRLDDDIRRIHDSMRAEGRAFMGAPAILAKNPMERAGDSFPDRDTAPRAACRDSMRRRFLRWLSEFRIAHRVAWLQWSSGARDVLFPYGTYWMRVKYGVRCRDPVPALGGSYSAA
jgi:putative transposase